MAKTLRVGLAQINTTVGDLDGNVRKALEYVERARVLGVDIVSFPELTVTGYPPEDLLLRAQFVKDNVEALQSMVGQCLGITAVIGFVDRGEHARSLIWGPVGATDVSHIPIYNAAAVIHDGRLAHVYHKERLPNYGVFDEARYFEADRHCEVYTVAGVDVGVNICEDIWYPGDPTEAQGKAGARVIVNINGSPYHAGKRKFREEMLAERARDYGVFVCYTNQVGGQDELVFDGGSMVIAPSGEVVARAGMFEEELLVVDLAVEELGARSQGPGERIQHFVLSNIPFLPNKPPIEARIAPEPEGEGEVYGALVLGTRDYLHKSGFERAVLALSGGIDSSIVAAIAVDAIGAENVHGVSMPSRYSSEGSLKDAKELAENLGIEFRIIPIEPAHEAFEEMLAPAFGGTEPGVAEENLQSRIRANVILALSNKFGWIVLTTGNKSELATGYATLAGDMVGGFAVIKDVPKTLVYRLARWRNSQDARPVIPEAVISKPPSAELRPGQLDADSLPPYEVLDPILEQYVEHDRSVQEIVAMGYDYATVARIAQMVDRNEYKRRQAPPGVKITPKAFGRDRRLPMASRYRAW
ncbi:MAG: NAD+ synthase [Chloroflexi bacterium]|nr:MAG: NAD+ synthase [Chloroflexota bacterium]